MIDRTLGPLAAPTGVEQPRQGGVAQTEGTADFASLLEASISGVSANLRRAESVSMAALRGAASTQDVVETVMTAERSLQTAIAVRDRIVAVYTELTKMPI